MGRKTTYTEKAAAIICERIADGEFLRVICREESMPSWRTVYDWTEAVPEFAARLARARDIGADAIAEDTLEIIDEPPAMIGEGFGRRVDPGYVQWQGKRVDQRLKLLSKWSKKYSDKVTNEHTGPGGGPVQMSFTSEDAKL